MNCLGKSTEIPLVWIMVAYQEDVVFTADGVAGLVNQIFFTVAPDFL